MTNSITPRYTRESIMQAFDAGTLPPFLMFWGHQPAKDGRIGKSCFSQWWMSDFVFEGESYCCMEQCMMAGKARLFGDHDALLRIMNSTDPKDIKALGRGVKNFDSSVWDKAKYSLIAGGNFCKFTQEPALRDFLLSTGDSVLVEASPYDCIWGIGLKEGDPRAMDPHQWRGLNLLGFALMQVRDQIRSIEADGNAFQKT